MLVHSVFFWLKPELTDEQRADFRKGVESLGGIGDAAAVYVGTPAATADRPVIDTSYDVGLTVILEDVAAHDRYQEHALHLAFLENFRTYWQRVQIYDVD
ncbi:MAG: Dabb family protein [Candidatus Hydrogenedens sp.]|nr:Dabb family protein [Candidatus Hydrogenedens sp.]